MTVTESLSARQEEIKAEFIAARGSWGDPWQTVLKIDPEFVAAYLHLYMVPWKKNYLSPKFKELCYLSVSAAATHLYVPGIHAHITAALDLGATPHEIIEVLELASTLGIHTMNIGVPLLVEVLEELGRTGPSPLKEYQERLKAEFTEVRGYWHDFWNEMLELDPEMFGAYTEFSSVPWKTGTLSPAEKELIYISYDIAATHLYVPGTKLHIRNALNHGATVEQILEVMEISSVLGIHAVTTAVPILAKELAERDIQL
ncbi:carboxymuconolactone decarboxylase family protein [Lacisediminihabitans profunda]|uniref:Gamma-carboxymuconolactone decarboxylase n=1 Tax=Lacisediminihabitans profunda TaxID=2594790 RepID=A0A5C8UNZ7_9MICO|nr:carboxymuconolactone decarboxylase family protein [Lacisediminihabitans profunda]TXN29953.1 gamma-carboxymuconolactone decarboxylase [Lacisediminihabitans profunda]